MTVESPPGTVIGHIALHHDFYGIYDKGMLTLLYSVPFKGDAGAHPVSIIEFSTDGKREEIPLIFHPR